MKEIAGRWRITAMDTWDQDYVDLIEPGFFAFDYNGMGSFVFGAVRGWLDTRVLDGWLAWSSHGMDCVSD